MHLDTLLRHLPLEAVAAEAQRLESLGFDGLWTVESAHDPFLPLALAAPATSRLQLGTNIAVAFARSPFATALVAWDLQKASQGRFHLGLGTQVRAHVERRFSMPFEHPAARVTDYIRCLRAIWDTFQNGTPPRYEGPFYRFTLINPFFNPGPIPHPHIPVYLAGVNPRMCRAAGEVADGFHVHPMHSVGYLREVVLPALAEGARRSGRRVEDLVLYAPVFTVSGETQAEMDAMAQEVRRQIAFYASTPSYRVLLDYHGYGALGRELSARMRQGDFASMPGLIPDALLEEVAVVASPAELPRKLRQRYEGLLHRVALYFPVSPHDPEEKWRQFIAAFRAAA
ncbi:MAG: LLM class F420-dependent oxidoreductase [Candidatus Tectimicrobiota bacterium]|nr:MAG: LLM class F420-dependent oxidoreductase [Candidatus Tectomicrobia bacterium]